MKRRQRVAELIRERVSETLREKVADPRIGFVSITRVDLSSDLENAKIFVSVLGSEKEKKDCLQGLASARRFIRGELGKALEMRQVPNISFLRDDSLQEGSRVLGVLARLKNE